MIIYSQGRQNIYDVCAIMLSRNIIYGESAVLGNVILGTYKSDNEASSVLNDMFAHMHLIGTNIYAMPITADELVNKN